MKNLKYDFIYPNLEEKIEKYGIKQKKIAAMIETTYVNFYRKRVGKIRFSDAEKDKIAEFFGENVSVLFASPWNVEHPIKQTPKF